MRKYIAAAAVAVQSEPELLLLYKLPHSTHTKQHNYYNIKMLCTQQE